jgi:hypothetical protein
VLHPVGPLAAAVYWRRRVLVLTLVVGVLGGSGWLGVVLIAHHRPGTAMTTAAATSSRTTTPAPRSTPALEQVVPAVAGVVLPTGAPAATTTAAALPGGPCTDAMLRLEIDAPTSASAADKPTFDLVITNVSAVRCVRAVDKGLQEMVMIDSAGTRIWGSNDCSPETSHDQRTLAPGETVSFPVLWSGLTSEPTCTAPRTAPEPGSYLLRGRLDTLTGPDTPITLT